MRDACTCLWWVDTTEKVDLVGGGSNGTIRENKDFLNNVPGLFTV